MTTLTLSQILISVAVIVALIVTMRLIQPKLSASEKYLLNIIQHKSPQIDNIRLFMYIKMIIHPIETTDDLDYQQLFLNDSEQFKQLSEQLYSFGAFALFPLLGYEAINWHLDPYRENPLFLRLTAIQVLRRYPHTAAVIEDLLIKAPDDGSSRYFAKNSRDFRPSAEYRLRYAYNLSCLLHIIVETSRNEWWPGTSPDIREWAEGILARIPQKFAELDLTALESNLPTSPHLE